MLQNIRLLWCGYLKQMEESSWHNKYPDFGVGDCLAGIYPSSFTNDRF